MVKLAADIVLLPSQDVAKAAFRYNQELIAKDADNIVFNPGNCLPHISLAMGCLEPKDVPQIEKMIRKEASQAAKIRLMIDRIHVRSRPGGKTMSSFSIVKSPEIQSLHQRMMEKVGSFFTYDADVHMFSAPPSVNESAVDFVSRYPNQSSYENFFPHITLGYGDAGRLETPIHFMPEILALCHLGRSCTCRRIIAQTNLKGIRDMV